MNAYDQWIVLENLIQDGAKTGPWGNCITLFHSLSESQRELMMIDIHSPRHYCPKGAVYIPPEMMQSKSGMIPLFSIMYPVPR